MTKRNADVPISSPRTTIRATDILSEIGNQDLVYSPWWGSFHRIINNFITEKAARLRESPDRENKTASAITVNIDQLEQFCSLATSLPSV